MFLAEKERRWGEFFFHVITKNCTAQENSGSQSAGHGTAAQQPLRACQKGQLGIKHMLSFFLKKDSDYWIVDL